LSEGYEKAKEIIRLQIDLINPDIIIGGNTLKYLINDYNLKTFKKVDNYPIKYTINDNRLFIDSNHPQYLSRQNEDYKGEYFDTLVNIVKEWWSTKQHVPNIV
jgi:uracil-DNA glycosylase